MSLTLREVNVTTDKVGESLDHYQLTAGDVALVDRGYNQPKSLVPLIDRGGHVVLRYNPHSMTLYERCEEPKSVKIDWEQRIRDLNTSRVRYQFICVIKTSILKAWCMP